MPPPRRSLRREDGARPHPARGDAGEVVPGAGGGRRGQGAGGIGIRHRRLKSAAWSGDRSRGLQSAGLGTRDVTTRTFATWVEPYAAQLRENREQVIAFACSLPAEAWDRPSPLPGWTYKDLLAHIGRG